MLFGKSHKKRKRLINCYKNIKIITTKVAYTYILTFSRNQIQRRIEKNIFPKKKIIYIYKRKIQNVSKKSKKEKKLCISISAYCLLKRFSCVIFYVLFFSLNSNECKNFFLLQNLFSRILKSIT